MGVACDLRGTMKKGPATEAFFSMRVGWLMGLEPTTTGITILDSTN